MILLVEEYERMLEDLHDLDVVAERREEETVSLEVDCRERPVG